MNTEKKIASTHVSDVARLMADESSCPHSVWFRSWHSSVLWANGSDHEPIDRDPRRTSLIRKTVAGLEKSGHRVFPALRNHFEARGSVTGARVSGRPDLIVRGPDGNVTVYDVRDEGPAEGDDHRVRLYMYLLPRANLGRWRGTRPAGCVLYPDGTERRIEAHEIDEAFVDRVATVMRQIVSDEPAGHSPSPEECGQCPLTSSDCSERVEPGTRSADSNGIGSSPSTC